MNPMTNPEFNEAAYHAAANAHGRMIVVAIILAFLFVTALIGVGYGICYFVRCAIRGRRELQIEAHERLPHRPNRRLPPRR